jgi:hypothetical protein
MMVITAKMKKRNIFLILAAIVAIALLLFRPSGNKSTATNSEVSHKANTNEGRIAFLESFGWEVEESPKESQDVRIPSGENEVFARYNDLQKSQGFDLSRYAGKTAKRFVYKITNHPGGGEYYATVLVRDGTIIGGDVASSNPGGKMHGFSMPT